MGGWSCHDNETIEWNGTIKGNKVIGQTLSAPSILYNGIELAVALTAVFVPYNGAASDVNINSKKITNMGNPSSAQDAATKNYVDSLSFSLDGLSDVTITSVNTGDILYKSSGDWKNFPRPTGFGTYKLTNTSAGAISWTSDVALAFTWNDVLSEGSTTSGVSPTISTNDKLYFRDTAIYVQSPTDSNLEVVADGDIKLNGATLTLTNSKNWKIGSLSAVASSVTGTTTETALATITIPANTLGANGQLRLYWVGSHTNSANTKTWRVRFNGITGTAIMTSSLTTTATVVDLRIIANRNATNSQVYWPGSSALINAGTSTVGTMAVDTTSAVDLVITAQLTNTGETMTLQNYCLEYTKGVSGWE